MGFYKNTNGALTPIAGGVSNSYAPIGAIFPFGGSSAPSGYLMCDGAAVSRTDYSALFAVIGTSFGAGDGSTTFNVPDLREATTKGVGLSGKSSNHYDSDGVALGEFVEDRVQEHIHGAMKRDTNSQTLRDFVIEETGIQQPAENKLSYSDYTYIGTNTGRSGNTTEVKAVGVNYIIKAKDVNLSVGGQALADRVSALETVSEMPVTKVNVASNSNVMAKKSGSVVNVNFSALLTLDQTTPGGTILVSGFPKPVFNVVRFGLYDASTMDVTTGLVQINSNGNLVADGQGLRPDTVYWGSFTYLTNE